MKKIKEIKGKGFYLFSGQACGNSSFIENPEEAKIFFTYINYYLNGYLKIHEYCINQNGWNLAIQLQSEFTIKSKFKKQKDIDNIKGWTVWKIISEQMRLTLSTYVRSVNHKRNRSGSLVHSSYERFVLENLEEGIAEIQKIRKHQLESRQKEVEYRPLVKHYELLKKEGRWAEWLYSGGKKVSNKIMSTLIEPRSVDLVVQNYILNTLKIHRLNI